MLNRNFTLILTRASSCSKSVRWGGGGKNCTRPKKLYSKLFLLNFGLKNMVKENHCPNRILTNKLYLSIHCTMYISDAVITANCFINIISIQRRGGGHFLPLGLPKFSGGNFLIGGFNLFPCPCISS